MSLLFHHISQVPSIPNPNPNANNSPPNPNLPSLDPPSLPSAKLDACGGETRQGSDKRGSLSLNSTVSLDPTIPDPDPQPQSRRRQPATHHHLMPTPVAQPAHRLAPIPPTPNSNAQSKTNASSSPPTASHHRRMPTPQTPASRDPNTGNLQRNTNPPSPDRSLPFGKPHHLNASHALCCVLVFDLPQRLVLTFFAFLCFCLDLLGFAEIE